LSKLFFSGCTLTGWGGTEESENDLSNFSSYGLLEKKLGPIAVKMAKSYQFRNFFTLCVLFCGMRFER